MMSAAFVVTAAKAFGSAFAHMTPAELDHWHSLINIPPIEAPPVPRRESGSQGDSTPLRLRFLVLTGQPSAGKDRVADMLVEKYAHVGRAAFSDAVMQEVNEVLMALNLGHRIHEGNKNHPPYRRLLQDWGMIKRRSEGERYWGARVFDLAAKTKGDCDLIVLTGARSPADIEVCVDHGAAVWRIDRPAQAVNTHPVERLLDHVPAGTWDAYLINREGDFDLLSRQIEAFLPLAPRHLFKPFLHQTKAP